MNNTNWDTFRVRCSGINKVLANKMGCAPITEKQTLRLIELEAKESLTEKQREELAELLLKKENGKKIVLGDTAIAYLMEVYAWEKEGMIAFSKEVWEIDQLQKGKLQEEDSITLISIVDGVLYLKNDERVHNDYLSGEPDVFLGDNIMNAQRIIDIKTCFDYPTFLKKINEDLFDPYKWQIQGYMDITGATEGELAYCLVNMPESMILDYQKKLFYRMDVATEDNPEYKKRWEIMERSMRFEKIPHQRRVFRQKINPFTEQERQRVYDRVKACREWLWKFDEKYQNINLPVEEVANVE